VNQIMVVDDTRPANKPHAPEASMHTRQRTPWGVIAAVLLVLAAGYVLTLLVFEPGYITVDARYVYDDARASNLGDWQSPVMGVLWLVIDPLAPGAWCMFLLTITLYWLGFGLTALAVARRSAFLGVLTPLLALVPPAFFLVGMIWRDVLFGVAWLVAAALPFALARCRAGVRVPLQALALCLVAFGVLLRPNAVAAAPILAAYVAFPARFDIKRAAIVFIPALLFFVLLVPGVYYGLLHAKRQNPLHSIMVFDLGGITHFSGENQFPVAWNAEQTALLRTKCYDPVRWDSYWHMEPCPFVMQRLEAKDDLIFGTPRLVEAWRRALVAHPLAYLQHRAAFMWQFLARSNLVLPVWDWQEPDATYGKNRYLQPLLALHQALEPTLLFRPGLWLLLAMAVGGLAWRARATPAGAFAVGATASGIVYVLTFFVLGVASDFRYAYWCVLAVLAAAPAACVARRHRSAGP
jgi:hypothetical protein